MNEPVFTITPSFISRLITYSSTCNNDQDIIKAFQHLKSFNSKTLTHQHADSISDARKSRQLIFDDMPDKLKPLAEDLWALIEVLSEEELSDNT